jgi:predicted HTH transcriptional regulator
MNADDISALFQQGESLTLEFKSDSKCLPDREPVAAVVTMANTEGGDLLLGVEKGKCVMQPTHETGNLRTCVLMSTHVCVEKCLERSYSMNRSSPTGLSDTL